MPGLLRPDTPTATPSTPTRLTAMERRRYNELERGDDHTYNDEVLEALAYAACPYGQAALADRIGVSPQVISAMLRGKQQISPKVGRYLGFERVVTWANVSYDQENCIDDLED